MKFLRALLVWLAVFVKMIFPATGSGLLLCGGSEVFLVDSEGAKTWAWQAADSPEIPEDWHGKFRKMDEVKPYDNGLLLVTSSSGGVALIERGTKRCVFLAEVKNAHSGCLLPNEELVFAASAGGDALVFFERGTEAKPAVAKWRVPLKGAHGTVWDAKAGWLWALGDKQLLKLKREAGGWIVTKRWNLPSYGGHDLSAWGDDRRMWVTTDTEVLLFSTATHHFEKHTTLGQKERVKSIDRHPATGKIVYQQATATRWWSDTVRFPDGHPIRFKGKRLYKARWDSPMRVP